ncbi:MAG: primosomal protein N' [Methylocystaceae bacterium]
MLAHVYADIPSPRLDRLFTYLVPTELEEKLQPGCRVLIPLGPREVEGYVRAVEDGTQEDLKPVLRLLDLDGPVLTEELLAMGEWMSGRYLCSVAQSLRIMVPASLKKKKQQQISWGGSDLDLLLLGDSYPNLGMFFNRLAAGEPITVTQARKVLGQQLLADLLTEETLVSEGSYHSNVHLTRFFTVQPLAESFWQQLKRRAPRQADLYAWLLEEGTGSENEIKGRFPGLRLQNLVAKGLLQEIKPDEQLSAPLQPTPEQQLVINQIADRRGEALLHGVTGSGKTEVYLQLINSRLKRGEACLVLVPEIGLTEHLITSFSARLGNQLAIWHSRMSAGERMISWQRLLRGEARVVLGPRSAIFAPVTNLGLIIIDEEQEPSFKQEEIPRYHAAEAARWRTERNGGLLVYGSATPSLECYHRAVSGETGLLSLEHRIGGRPMPQVEVVDMREELRSGNRSMFSNQLQAGLQGAIERNEQAIIFINRRGFASFVLCRACGYRVECTHCSVAMTYHQSAHQMVCHYCGQTAAYPAVCPVCGSSYIRQFGTGTERVEEALKGLLPAARIARMDMDTTRGKHSHRQIIDAMNNREIDVLVGTQMVAKGFDFPSVSLVGVLAADSLFNLPDFRAAERAYQLLSQVAGRAGRGQIPGQVLIQTYEPDHPVLQHIRHHDYPGFYRDEIMERARLDYPPFTRILKIVAWSEDREQARDGITAAAEKVHNYLQQQPGNHDVKVLGPAPCPIFRLRGQYRYGITLKSTNGSLLLAIGQYIIEGKKINVRLEVDIDPVNTY